MSDLRERSYSLSGFVLVFTAFTALFAAARSAWLNTQDIRMTVTCIIGAATFGAVVGSLSAIGEPAPWRTSAARFIFGGVAGGLTGVQLSATPEAHVVIGGAVLILTLACVIRFFSGSRAHP